MPLEVPDGAGSNGRAMQVGCAGYHGDIRVEAQILRHVIFNRPQDIDCTLQIRKFFTADPKHLQQSVVVIDPCKVAVIGNPVKGDRIKGCAKPTGKPQVDIIFGLQEFISFVINLRSLGL